MRQRRKKVGHFFDTIKAWMKESHFLMKTLPDLVHLGFDSSQCHPQKHPCA
jgi:hypothetical protein